MPDGVKLRFYRILAALAEVRHQENCQYAASQRSASGLGGSPHGSNESGRSCSAADWRVIVSIVNRPRLADAQVPEAA